MTLDSTKVKKWSDLTNHTSSSGGVNVVEFRRKKEGFKGNHG
jgi:hypothetical protein